MHKAKRIYVLLGVLVVLCIAVLAVSQHEEKKEQIKNGEKIILEIPADSVTALSWTNEEGTFSFTKGSSWTYDGDNAFPVDRQKIENLISQFESFTAAFTIENVEDEAMYGLDEPVCTISVTTEEETYQLKLGDFSKMDAQRYVSIGDGCAYLVSHDPLEEFDAVLRDMILDDTIPAFDSAEEIKFTGIENYTITQEPDGQSICADDVYFTDGRPLDTSNVESFLTALQALSLTDYASYNASDEELQEFGLDDPDLMIELKYTADEKENKSGSVVISVSRSPEEVEAYEKAVEQGDENLPTVTCYARVDQSQIVYQISQNDYNELTAVSYDVLRHQKLFTASFDTVTSIDVELDGEEYTLAMSCRRKRMQRESGCTGRKNLTSITSARRSAHFRRSASRKNSPKDRKKLRSRSTWTMRISQRLYCLSTVMTAQTASPKWTVYRLHLYPEVRR